MQTRKLFIATLVAVTWCAQLYAAVPESPHMEVQAQTGVLTGKLLKDGKTPVPNHTVTLEIINRSALVLAIPKQTDSKGQFEFKNIFQSPEFSYAVSAEYDGKLYRTDFVSLKKGEARRALDLQVGMGAIGAQPIMPPSQEAPPDVKPPRAAKDLGQYKFLAFVLALGAAGLAFFQRRK